MSVVIGSSMWPVAMARDLRSAIEDATSGEVTSFALIATTAGICPPGNAACILS